MNIIEQLRSIQNWINKNSVCGMNYNLNVIGDEIKLQITISVGWEFLYDDSRNWNACDWETNYRNCKRYIKSFEYEKYGNVNSSNYKDYILE